MKHIYWQAILCDVNGYNVEGECYVSVMSINKRLAHLHDFIVVPPDPSDSGSRAVLKGELERAREFAELSANGGSPGGPFDKIDNLMVGHVRLNG